MKKLIKTIKIDLIILYINCKLSKNFVYYNYFLYFYLLFKFMNKKKEIKIQI